MGKPRGRRRGAQPYGEKEFYLEEFRGRSVLIAVAPAVVAARGPLKSLGAAVSALVRNDTPVVVWWPHVVPHSERRLLAALGRAPTTARRARRKKRRARRRRVTSPLLRVSSGDFELPHHRGPLKSALWSRLRETGLCVFAAGGFAVFPRHPMELAVGLGVPKVVLVDPRGGLDADGARLSFVDENVLETVLQQGQAEWSGLGDRRVLLMAVREGLDAGVEQVNLCPPDGVADELFTYAGSGTLFTEGDYTRVGPLALDEFEQAERLLERGQREGLLKLRSSAEIAELLGAGFGVTVCGRHLAGVAGLLTAPYVAERAGEIAGLYTINRFKGEGLGDRLVERMLQEAEVLGLEYVFAVTLDERAQQFFDRQGFTRVEHDAVPARKWAGYDGRRRLRLVAFRRALPARASAAERAS